MAETNRTPKAVLLESNGFTNWTAVTDEECAALLRKIEAVNAARAEHGLDPIRELNIPADIPADFPEHANTAVTELLAADTRVWVIDLREQNAMQAAYNVLPGIFKTLEPGQTGAGKYGVAPIVNFQALATGGRGWPRTTVLEGDAVRAAVDSALAEARDLILSRLPDDNAARRVLATTDPLDERFTDALTGLSEEPSLILAASAMHTAVGMARAGNIPGCLTWSGRVAESLSDVVPASDVNADVADSIPLAWVAEDEIHTGNVAQLGEHISQIALGAPDITTVYTVAGGALVPVTYQVNGTKYDEHDMATATLTVTLPDGSRLEESWRVDGRV